MTIRSLAKIAPLLALAGCLFAHPGAAAVGPVAQLPTVTAGVTPSPYVLPILLVNDQNEWKDFGIHLNLKIYPNGEDQAERVVGNEWDVGVLDPFYAVKAGNEGDIAVIGAAGNMSGQFYLLSRREDFPSRAEVREALTRKEILTPGASTEHFFLSSLFGKPGEFLPLSLSAIEREPAEGFLKGKGRYALLRSPQALLLAQQNFHAWPDLQRQEAFLPMCLVASAAFADTRKTLVVRWLEGYARGVRLIAKNPAGAASRLKEFYRETLKIEIPQPLLEKEITEAFFTAKGQEEAFLPSGSQASAVERFAGFMGEYQVRMKVLKATKEPGEYILDKMCGQLAALRREAEAQFNRTRMSIDQAEKEGMKVENFRVQLEEARGQLEDGRGCLTVIGTLSNLMRSAEQATVEKQRLKKFRFIELGVGVVLIVYYAGYFGRRRNRQKGKKG